MNWRRVALVGVTVLLLNQVLFGLFRPETARIKLPYNTFREQVVAGNVDEVHAKGDTIEGTLKTVLPDPNKPKVTAKAFRTERPTFAENDGLYQDLKAHNVEVNAKSPKSSLPLWQSFLFGFGPNCY